MTCSISLNQHEIDLLYFYLNRCYATADLADKLEKFVENKLDIKCKYDYNQIPYSHYITVECQTYLLDGYEYRLILNDTDFRKVRAVVGACDLRSDIAQWNIAHEDLSIKLDKMGSLDDEFVDFRGCWSLRSE